MTDFKEELERNGYCIIPNVLTEDETTYAYNLVKEWQKTIQDHDFIHNAVNPHGIYKYHEAGHTRHAWFLRTRPEIQKIFKELWNTDELIVSFDGCCYIPKTCIKKDKYWTHSDQAPTSKGLQCYQGFVSLTNNKERSIVVYDKTHLIHSKYFEDRKINNSKNWNLISEIDLKQMEDSRVVLNVPKGSLVLWDSRTFHQNQYGKPNSEERIVQYICYLPKSHKSNTPQMQKKRQKYFQEKRTTSHWPAPIRVNGKQPQTYGNNRRLIDYESLEKPYLDDLMDDINKLL